jgi:hypothetical protein
MGRPASKPTRVIKRDYAERPTRSVKPIDIEPEDSGFVELYFGTLVNRMMARIEAKRQQTRTLARHRQLTHKNLARLTGIPHNSVQSYLCRKNREMDVDVLDKFMWASKISILDLLTPNEIMSYLNGMNYKDRAVLNAALKRTMARKALDIGLKPVSNSVGPTT